MAYDYTTRRLINSIEVNSSMPLAPETFDRVDLLNIADEQMIATLVPTLLRIKGKYKVHSYDYTMTSETTYAIPPDASGQILMTVVRVHNNVESDIPMLDVSETRNNTFAGTGLYGFWIEDNNIRLYNSSVVGDVLRIYYYVKPNKLVQIEEAAQVTEIDGYTVTVAGVPLDWEGGEEINVIHGKPGFETKLKTVLTSIAGNDFVLEETTGIAVGDWIALIDESPIPQIPHEMHPLLSQAVIVKLLESLGDLETFKACASVYVAMEKNLISLMAPRVSLKRQKILTNNNLINYVRNRGRRYW